MKQYNERVTVNINELVVRYKNKPYKRIGNRHALNTVLLVLFVKLLRESK